MASLAMIALTSNLWDRKMFIKILEILDKIPIFRVTVCLLLIWIVFFIHKRDIKIADLQSQIVETNIQLEKAKEDIEKLQAYCEELEAANDINKAEFVNIWESLATVRNNFLALGHGLHLAREDICPESEPECNHQKLEEEM